MYYEKLFLNRKGGGDLTSTLLSEKLQKILPNKKVFLMFFMILASLTIGAMVALANENTVTVETSVLNVRYGPGLSHDVLTQVKEKDRLFVLGEENKWYKVRLNNDQIGWVASWLVTSEDLTQGKKEYVKVTGEAVNIRQFSNTDSEVLGTVYKDTELQVLYQNDDWYQILYLGQVAWIHGDYIEELDLSSVTIQSEETESDKTKVSSIVRIGDSVTNIRKSPTINSDVVHLAEPNETFEYIETVDDWHHIKVDENHTGYVAAWLSSIEDANVDAKNTEAPSTETVQAQHARKATSLAEATIVIDAGHGGYDPGAVSLNKDILEKDVSLSTALLLRDRLKDAGTNVILTRSDDEFISLDQRVQTALNNNADAFISLHYDAIEPANSMSGTTTYYHMASDLELANTINRYLDQNGPLPNNGVRLANYYVLRTNRQPSVLLELGYMNNYIDTRHINTKAYQSAVVEAIYQGLREYYSQ